MGGRRLVKKSNADPARSQFSKAKVSQRRRNCLWFFLMEIVVSSSLSFHVKSSKEDVFEFVLRVPPVKDDEDGSIYKRTEYNKRTDDLQDSR